MTRISPVPEARDFDAYPGSDVIAEAPGLRARIASALPSNAGKSWHRMVAATTTVFARDSGVAVQIQKPPFRCTLQAGEFYSVPPGVDMSVHSVGDSAADFVVFEYGSSLECKKAAPPNLAYFGERTTAEVVKIKAPQREVSYEEFETGLTRMDVLASPDSLRLIVQGHGECQCVPWHSHDHISDTFFCVSGNARIATRGPESVHVLAPGETCQVQRGVAHFVSGEGGGSCELLVLQGVGTYNYVAL